MLSSPLSAYHVVYWHLECLFAGGIVSCVMPVVPLSVITVGVTEFSITKVTSPVTSNTAQAEVQIDPGPCCCHLTGVIRRVCVRVCVV